MNLHLRMNFLLYMIFHEFLLYMYFNRFIYNVKGSCFTVASTTDIVSQGSILQPPCFIFNVNDMTRARDCELYLHADDPFLFS